MIYAQEKAGQRLHIVAEAGEVVRGQIVTVGRVSQPLCGRKVEGYRMTCNLPLANACKNCRRVYAAGKYS